MVRVWYEPPPFGGRGTDLNRSGYGMHSSGGGLMRSFLERASKQKSTMMAMMPFIAASLVFSYIPVSKFL